MADVKPLMNYSTLVGAVIIDFFFSFRLVLSGSFGGRHTQTRKLRHTTSFSPLIRLNDSNDRRAQLPRR